MMHELGRVVDCESEVKISYQLKEGISDENKEYLIEKMSSRGYGISSLVRHNDTFIIKERIVGRLPTVKDKDKMLRTFKAIVSGLKKMDDDLNEVQ